MDDQNTTANTEPGTDTAVAELPKAVVQRIVKARAAQIVEASSKGSAPAAAEKKAPNVQVSKDALLAFSESAKVFISYVTSNAAQNAKDGKRVTVSAADVLKALEDTDFGDMVQPVQQYLDAHKGTLKEKPAAKKREAGSTAKKRKADTTAATPAADQALEKDTEPAASPVPIAPLQTAAADEPMEAAEADE